MPPRVVNVNEAGTGIGPWYSSLPPITRFYGTALFAATVLFHLGLLPLRKMALLWPEIWTKFEVWRLVTCFFFLGKFSFNFLIKLIWIVTYGGALESQTFQFEPAGYLFMLLFGGGLFLLVSLIIKPLLGIPLFLGADSLVFMMLYLWSRHFPDQQVSIMGLVKILSFYLPFAFVAVSILMGSDPTADIVGIVIGHVYFFLTELYPASSGITLISTPLFLKNWLADRGIGAPQVTHGATNQPGFQPFRGHGMRLGTG